MTSKTTLIDNHVNGGVIEVKSGRPVECRSGSSQTEHKQCAMHLDSFAAPFVSMPDADL